MDMIMTWYNQHQLLLLFFRRRVKGQKVYAWSDGTASSIPTDQLVGVALEANAAQEEKLVEVFLKV